MFSFRSLNLNQLWFVLIEMNSFSFHFQIDVTSFAKNCHEDTCNCNLGGDCECLCTSVAAYAYKCCQEGVSVHWRSSTVCCEYPSENIITRLETYKEINLSYHRTNTMQFIMQTEFKITKLSIPLTMQINCSTAKGLIKLNIKVKFSILCDCCQVDIRTINCIPPSNCL